MDEATEAIAPMRFREFPPPEPLAPFVVRFIHGSCPEPGRGRLEIPPTGGLFLSWVPDDDLVVRFGDGRTRVAPRLFVGGQLRQDRPGLTTAGRFGLLGVEFRPAGFHQLFRVAAHPFTDDLAPLDRVPTAASADLAERLAKVETVEETVRRIASHLTPLVRDALRTPRVDAAVEALRDSRGTASISAIARTLGTDGRALRREFLTAVGLPPKQLAKSFQLAAAFQALRDGDGGELARVALDAGYADHAHFSRDFKRLVGLRPQDFLRSRDRFLRTFLGRQLRFGD